MAKFSEIAGKIDATLGELSELSANTEFLVNQQAAADISFRIFNEGIKTDGSPIGKYKTKSYIKKRDDAGRQTGYVDFQFKGDLLRAFGVGQLNGKPAVGFTSEKEVLKSEGLEEKFGIVFQASTEEKDKAIDDARDYMFEGLREIIKKWS